MNNEENNTTTTTEEMGRRKQGRRGNGYGGVILRGNTYYCRYTDALGNRREVSSHSSDKDEALKFLATLTKPIRESASIEETKLRLQQSLDVLELRGELAKVERLRLEDIIQKFTTHRDFADTAPNTIRAYAQHLQNLVKFINAKYPNLKYIDEVTSSVVNGVLDDLTKHYTAASYNLALATYRRVWGMFARNNPWMKVNKRKIDKSRHRIAITEDDMRKIMAACRDDVERAVWGVGAYTGLRCGDVCCLTYGHLSKDLSTLTITPQKTKRHMADPIVIPICPALRNLLTKVLKIYKLGNDEFRNEPLWADYKKRYDGTLTARFFRHTLTRAGIQVSHKDEQGHVQVDSGYHICRHYFISCASKYMSPLLVQRIVGHSAISMTAHYYHANQDEMREGLSAMPDLTTARKTNENAPVSDSVSAEVMKLLGELKRGEETPLETLKRIVASSIKLAS